MTIKRYYEEIHESCDWAELIEDEEGHLVEVSDIRERLETVLVFCPEDPYDIVRLRIEEMLEELQ